MVNSPSRQLKPHFPSSAFLALRDLCVKCCSARFACRHFSASILSAFSPSVKSVKSVVKNFVFSPLRLGPFSVAISGFGCGFAEP
jgi:hypothetical protein